MVRTHFEQKLDELTGRLVAMSRLIEGLIETSLEAVHERDISKAEAVVIGDREIDATEVEIEEACVELLALQQPMAGDLRCLIAILKINNDLERIGDHAVNIAETAQRLIERNSDWTLPIELSEAAGIAQGMLRDVLDAFVQHDADKAQAVLMRDDRVDQLHESHLRSAITLMMESPAEIGTALSFILIGRNIERVADLACNIGEDVVYLVKGKTIRHPKVLHR
ncbi:MAG: phosphate signaling complex protein PhoU [Gemmatimonadota bacterium]|nr:MAG: phosphate signaling complex protein PhoU [Gemmatimonadota bacterium]